MATHRPVRLSPKIRDLVAVDRLGRPAVGRLTAAQAEALVTVALREGEFDEPVSAPRAIAALARGRPRTAMPVLEAVLLDEARPGQDRVAAATGLGRIATPEAEELLLRAARDRDPRVQQATFKALGWFGSPQVARELVKIQPSDVHARRQMEFARALAVHRHGLEGPFLSEAPTGRTRLTERSKTTTFSFSLKTARATANDLSKVQGATFGIAFAARGLELQCGRREWTLFVNEELDVASSAAGRLLERPWIAAVAYWWYPVRTIATPQYVVLTRPVEDRAHVDVVRMDGEIVFTGTAEPRGATTAFSLAEAERPGAAPLRMAGRLTSKGVELDVALAAASRVRTPTSEPVSPR